MEYQVLPECMRVTEFAIKDLVKDFTANEDELFRVLEIEGNNIKVENLKGDPLWQTDFRCLRKVVRQQPVTYWGVFFTSPTVPPEHRFFFLEAEARKYLEDLKVFEDRSVWMSKFQEVKE